VDHILSYTAIIDRDAFSLEEPWSAEDGAHGALDSDPVSLRLF